MWQHKKPRRRFQGRYRSRSYPPFFENKWDVIVTIVLFVALAIVFGYCLSVSIFYEFHG